MKKLIFGVIVGVMVVGSAVSASAQIFQGLWLKKPAANAVESNSLLSVGR